MIYRFGISTPANTSKGNQQKTVLKIARGIIHQLEVIFPSGPGGLLHVKINRGLHQVWPSNSDEAFASDNESLSFREHLELLTEPYKLEVYTWNEDDTYPHSVIIRLAILPRKFILRRLF